LASFIHSSHLPLFFTKTNARRDTICRDQIGERIQYCFISNSI
jgi:hypothetical protein